MIESIAEFRPYDPRYHTIPIRWLRSRLLNKLVIGQHETIQSTIPTRLYPVGTIVVKVSSGRYHHTNIHKIIRQVEIHFVANDGILAHLKPPLAGCHRGKVTLFCEGEWGNGGWHYPSDQLTKITFTGYYSRGYSLTDFGERLTYVNYIIQQLNTL